VLDRAGRQPGAFVPGLADPWPRRRHAPSSAHGAPR
jgi:hypothetical protein